MSLPFEWCTSLRLKNISPNELRTMAFRQMRTVGLTAGQTVSPQTKEDCSCLFSIWACSILARHNCVLGFLFEELAVGILLLSVWRSLVISPQGILGLDS